MRPLSERAVFTLPDQLGHREHIFAVARSATSTRSISLRIRYRPSPPVWRSSSGEIRSGSGTSSGLNGTAAIGNRDAQARRATCFGAYRSVPIWLGIRMLDHVGGSLVDRQLDFPDRVFVKTGGACLLDDKITDRGQRLEIGIERSELAAMVAQTDERRLGARLSRGFAKNCRLLPQGRHRSETAT